MSCLMHQGTEAARRRAGGVIRWAEGLSSPPRVRADWFLGSYALLGLLFSSSNPPSGRWPGAHTEVAPHPSPAHPRGLFGPDGGCFHSLLTGNSGQRRAGI